MRKGHRGLIPVFKSFIFRDARSSVDRRGGSRASFTSHSRQSAPLITAQSLLRTNRAPRPQWRPAGHEVADP